MICLSFAYNIDKCYLTPHITHMYTHIYIYMYAGAKSLLLFQTLAETADACWFAVTFGGVGDWSNLVQSCVQHAENEIGSPGGIKKHGYCFLHPEVQTNMKTMGVNITTIVYLRIVII